LDPLLTHSLIPPPTPQKLLPQFFSKTNAQLTDERKTAFTPAGYAFSIWGLIYAFGTAFIVFQALPSQKADWVWRKVGLLMMVNLVANAAWLPLFQNEVLGLWLAVAVIALGIVLPLAILHRRFWHHASYDNARWAEYLCCFPFISLYLGWTCVATIANIAIALTPSGGIVTELAGLSASHWSIVMMSVASLLSLAVVASSRFRDGWFPLPIAWAIAAIGVRQRNEDAYPGDDSVVLAAWVLSAAVSALALGTTIHAVIRGLTARAARKRQEEAQQWAATRGAGPAAPKAGAAPTAIVTSSNAAFQAQPGQAPML